MGLYNFYAAEYDRADVAHICPIKIGVYSTRSTRDGWVAQSTETRSILPGASAIAIQARNLGALGPNRVYDLADLAERNRYSALAHKPPLTHRGLYLCYAYQYEVGDLLNLKAPEYLAVFDNRPEQALWCDKWRDATEAYGIKGFSDYVESVRKAPLRVAANRKDPLMTSLLNRMTLYPKTGGNVYLLDDIFSEGERQAYGMRRQERTNRLDESWAQDEYVKLAAIENRRGNYIYQSAESSDDDHFWRKNLAGLHRQREAYDMTHPEAREKSLPLT